MADAGPMTARESSFIKQYLIMEMLGKMNEHKANGDRDKYYIRWKFCCQLVMPHMRFINRKKLQEEFGELKKIERQIEELPEDAMNAATKVDEILKLRYAFADNREYYIMDTLPKLGLGQDYEEGVIDFTKYDIDSIARAARDTKVKDVAAVEKNVTPVASEESDNPEIEMEPEDDSTQLPE